jgi:non-ribosomal peptide synthetase-like protein
MGETHRCLHHFYEQQADIRPDSPALISRTKTQTYREVEISANRIARLLRSKGIAAGDLVGLYFERSELPIITMLGILKAGAGYVPIDPAYPEDRMRHIVTDASITVLCTERSLAGQGMPFFAGTAVVVDDEVPALERFSGDRLDPAEVKPDEKNLSYIIYTSGSTGKPKGVMTEHRNIVHFVDAFKRTCALTPDDRVYQGFSFGFDGSVEEIWMAFANGAALVVGSDDMSKLGPETARYLTEKKVSYFSTVPTFLSMMDGDLPTVKLLIVSGEACPQELVDRWAINGRRMLNVYGPTETTVNTTAAECRAGKPITIGAPIEGYQTFILDERMQPVPHGESGELFIGGPGLARGYMNLPETTTRAFIPKPSHINASSSRLYKTGDLVSENAEGELHFYGRIDSQVKIRGYRIECSEIEAVLREHPGVEAAAVTTCSHDGVVELAAFIVERPGVSVDRNEILSLCRRKLPSYMIPSYLDPIGRLPTLTSGKTDRKLLPAPRQTLVNTGGVIEQPRSETEKQLAAIWKEVFKVAAVSIDDDFFMDLGGYSLLAAQAVSVARKRLGDRIAVRDVYRFPTIRKLAAQCDSAAPPQTTGASGTGNPAKISARRVLEGLSSMERYACIVLQAFSVVLFYGVGVSFVMISVLLYNAIRSGALGPDFAIGIGIAAFLLAYPLLLTLSIVAKWTVVGRFKPGNYPVWGMYYFRWWLVTRLQRLSGAQFLAGTPLMAMYLRLMGAKIGSGSILNSSLCSIFDLLSIGDNTCIGYESQLLGYRVEDGMLHIGRITIGSNCFIGTQSAVGIDAVMEDGSRLDDLSLLGDHETIPKGESRRGSPLQPAPANVPECKDGARTSRNPVQFAALSIVGVYLLEAFLLLAALPSVYVLYLAFNKSDWLWWALCLVISIPLFEITFWTLLIAVKYAVIGRTKPGVYRIGGIAYMRKWLLDSLLSLSRLLTLPLYTTLYILPLLRLLGVKIGHRAELSVVSYLAPDVVEIGMESFFADGSIIGGVRLNDGLCAIESNAIGRRSFVGNSAVLPPGKRVGDNGLIGVLSAPPADFGQTPGNTEWLGSPAFRLPHRKKVEGYGDTVTFRPSFLLYCGRLAIDALRIIIPSSIEIAGLIGLLVLTARACGQLPLPVAIALLPCIGVLYVLFSALAVILTKNFLMGTYAPVVKPLWSPYVWLNEAVNGAYESIAAPLLTPLLGTPFFAPFLRMLGAKVGKNAFIETALFGEFDLVEIGDYAALNFDVVIQNHLFEDRIFKSSRLKIGDGCSIGNMAVVLYDTEMENGSSIGPLSLLMKGERVPAASRWQGIPIQGMHGTGQGVSDNART